MEINSASTIILPRGDEEVANFLTYDDKSVRYLIHKLQQNRRFKYSNPERWEAQLTKLKSEVKKNLLKFDLDGNPYTYSGLWPDLQNRFGWELNSNIILPDKQLIPWKEIPYDMRYYQDGSVEALIKNRHGSIELPTGSGKTLILLYICRELGIPTIIVTPFKAVTNQVYSDFIKCFGKKYVGKYGDGRKDLGKLFTVCVAKSLTMIEKDTDAWDWFSKCKAIAFDESHVTPAETFQKICTGLAAEIPYRFFVSATQLRTDGSELLLKGIIGPVVYRKTYLELVEEKFLKQIIPKIFEVDGPNFNYTDPLKERQHHHLFNGNILRLAADIADKAIHGANRQTLIFVEEFRQFTKLLNFLHTSDFEFCHGGVTKATKKILPEKYWKTDIDGAVKRFNSGELKLLIGTSAITTGVDFQPAGCGINLTGGKSEIKLRQMLGRLTRPVEGLPMDFWFCDFVSRDSTMMMNQTKVREGIYKTMIKKDKKVERYGL